MKVSNNFSLKEFMPSNLYSKWGNASIWFIDPKIITLAQFIRDHFGASMTINGKIGSKTFNYRGFRPPTYKGGGKLSQHRFGRAIDFNIKGITPNDIRKEILSNSKEFMSMGLTVLEHEKYAPTWVHADIRTTNKSEIFIVKPKS